MEFRVVTAADVEAVAELWRAAGVGGGSQVDRAEIVERLSRTDDRALFILGEVEGAPVATAMGCYDGHRGWVKRVAIDSARHRSGLGRELVAELENRFHAAGITKLRLAANDEDAARFWSAVDYRELPEIHYFTKDLTGAADDGC